MRTNPSTGSVSIQFARALEGVFEELEIPYFLGGSRRFGYDRSDSDTDFFVLVKDEKVENHLVSQLKEMGFTADKGGELYAQFHLILNLRRALHVGILLSEDSYENLREEHEKVERLLNEEPLLRNFARELGCMRVRGTLIYRALRKIAHTS